MSLSRVNTIRGHFLARKDVSKFEVYKKKGDPAGNIRNSIRIYTY